MTCTVSLLFLCHISSVTSTLYSLMLASRKAGCVDSWLGVEGESAMIFACFSEANHVALAIWFCVSQTSRALLKRTLII